MGHDEETAAAIRELVAKGGGNGVIFSVDDRRKSYEELLEKGVEFTQEPTEYGSAPAYRSLLLRSHAPAGGRSIEFSIRGEGYGEG